MMLRTTMTMTRPNDRRVDCSAWNLTVRFSSSMSRKKMPVINPRTYARADSVFSLRPKDVRSMFFSSNG
jgi:hypothetical protein